MMHCPHGIPGLTQIQLPVPAEEPAFHPELVSLEPDASTQMRKHRKSALYSMRTAQYAFRGGSVPIHPHAGVRILRC